MAPMKKKPSEKATANPPPSTLHSPYIQMITEAVSLLKDRTGSSQPAIAKIIEEKYQRLLPPNYKKTLSIQLKKFVKSGKLVKVKNSYKISSTEKVKPTSKSDSTEVLCKNKSVKKVTAAKTVEKAVKMKSLSQVKTPDALKRKSMIGDSKKSGGKMKKLDKVNTAEGTKKKVSTPVKRKVSKSAKSAPKKAKN